MRAQLAEANAARLTVENKDEEKPELLAKKESNASAEAAELRSQLDVVKKELSELKMRAEVSEKGYEGDEMTRLLGDLEQMRSRVAESSREVALHVEKSHKLEKELQESQAATAKLQSELQDMSTRAELSEREKGNDMSRLKDEMEKMRLRAEASGDEAGCYVEKCHKLQEKLSETQAEASTLRCKVDEITTQLDKTNERAEEKLLVTERESKKLQEEVKIMKEKLSQSHSEIVQQAADHLQEKQKMDAELYQSQQVAANLRTRLVEMDNQVAIAENEAEMHRRREQIERTEDNAQSLRKLSGDVFQLLKKKLDGMD